MRMGVLVIDPKSDKGVSEPIPAQVMSVLALMHSVLELELLLLLQELPDQPWTSASVAGMLNGDPSCTRSALSSLSRAGLVDRLFGAESVCFRFNPRSAGAVEQLARLYPQSRPRIIQFLEAQSQGSLGTSFGLFRLGDDSE